MISILLALAFSSVPATASPLVEGRAAAAAAIEGALSDIAFLDKNADNCTRYGARLRAQFLVPIAKELKEHQENLAVLGVFAPPTLGCAAPSPADFASASSAAAAVGELVQLRLTMAETPQGQFFGYSGDQVMDLALEAAPGFPNCVPQEKGNPRSTPELRAYYAMKAKFMALKGVMKSVADEATAPTAPVCRN